MMEYQKLYSLLFNTCTDALESINAQNFGQARDLLVKAQQECEERYISRETKR